MNPSSWLYISDTVTSQLPAGQTLTSSSLPVWMSSVSLCTNFSSFSHLEKKWKVLDTLRLLSAVVYFWKVHKKYIFRELTWRTSCLKGAGSTQLMRRSSRSIMAEASMCFSTRPIKPSFFFRKVITWKTKLIAQYILTEAGWVFGI